MLSKTLGGGVQTHGGRRPGHGLPLPLPGGGGRKGSLGPRLTLPAPPPPPKPTHIRKVFLRRKNEIYQRARNWKGGGGLARGLPDLPCRGHEQRILGSRMPL